jgi:hypothetical protein
VGRPKRKWIEEVERERELKGMCYELEKHCEGGQGLNWAAKPRTKRDRRNFFQF